MNAMTYSTKYACRLHFDLSEMDQIGNRHYDDNIFSGKGGKRI